MATPFTNRTRISLAALAMAGVFVIDTFTRLQSAVAVLYALVLIVADDGTARTRTSAWAYPCGVLALVSFLINHGGKANTDEMLRLLASLAAITVAALLTSRNGRLHEQVRISDARYETIFNSLALAIWEHDFTLVVKELTKIKEAVTDLEAHLRAHPGDVAYLRRLVKITHANAAARRLLEVSDEAPFFENLSDFLPDDDSSFVEALLSIDRRSPAFETECQVRTANNTLVAVFVAMRLPVDGTGYDRICASALDLTERKRMEKHLEVARLERDEALHRAIIGSLSIAIAHDVSQPLSSINAYLATARRWLARTPADVSEASQAIAQAEHAGDDAARVIDGVRELVAKGRLERSIIAFDHLVGGVVDAIQTRQPGLSFELSLGGATAAVSGEAHLLEQLVSSLVCTALSNARLQESRTGIRIVTSADQTLVRLAIACGRTNDAAEQSESAHVEPHLSEGGLGLCRSLARFHGGTILATSSIAGEMFHIELTLPRAPHRNP